MVFSPFAEWELAMQGTHRSHTGRGKSVSQCSSVPTTVLVGAKGPGSGLTTVTDAQRWGRWRGHLVQTPVDVLKQCCSSLLSRSEVPEATLGEGSWQQSLLTVALDGDYALGPSSALWSSHGSACPTLAPAQSSDRALWSKAPGNRRTPATKPPEKPRRHSGAWACRAGDSALVVLLPLCSLHRSRTSPPPIPQAPF
jgi:hypothetical protein